MRSSSLIGLGGRVPWVGPSTQGPQGKRRQCLCLCCSTAFMLRQCLSSRPTGPDAGAEAGCAAGQSWVKFPRSAPSCRHSVHLVHRLARGTAWIFQACDGPAGAWRGAWRSAGAGGKTVPLPGVSTDFAAKTVPLLVVLRPRPGGCSSCRCRRLRRYGRRTRASRSSHDPVAKVEASRITNAGACLF